MAKKEYKVTPDPKRKPPAKANKKATGRVPSNEQRRSISRGPTTTNHNSKQQPRRDSVPPRTAQSRAVLSQDIPASSLALTKKSIGNRFSHKPLNNMIMLLILSLFQCMTATTVIFAKGEADQGLLRIFACLLAVEWAYVLFFSLALHRRNFELEFIGLFLSSVGLVSLASIDPAGVQKQFITMMVGFAAFTALTFMLGNLDFCMKMRVPAALAALGMLAFTVLFAKDFQGAKNWITIGGFTLQLSEFVKVLFVFVGAATLEKIQTTKSIWIYIGFACACVGCLFLMRDFGGALIFFFTFLIIAFLQSGDFRTIIFSCTAGLLGGGLILKFKPYVMSRFKAYRHVWDYQFDKGWQQTNVLIGMASGGLFGLGIGQGNVRKVIFAQTDLMFGVICEEWGLLFGLVVVLAFTGILISAIKNSLASRSTFYTIAACAAAGLLLFQASLNIFGVTDLLPLTGVTLPFVSQGGSSIICCWGLLAFIKASDARTYSYLGTTRATPKAMQKNGGAHR